MPSNLLEIVWTVHGDCNRYITGKHLERFVIKRHVNEAQFHWLYDGRLDTTNRLGPNGTLQGST